MFDPYFLNIIKADTRDHHIQLAGNLKPNSAIYLNQLDIQHIKRGDCNRLRGFD